MLRSTFSLLMLLMTKYRTGAPGPRLALSGLLCLPAGFCGDVELLLIPFVATLGGGILTCFDLGAVTSMGVASLALSTAGVLSAAFSISPDDESCRRMTMFLQ